MSLLTNHSSVPNIPTKLFNMKLWSDSPIHPSFTVKVFVDTNILSYLVDNTYQSLSDFIDFATHSIFVELVSSKYVIFEFVGVRKKEHYLREVAAASKLSPTGKINFSSLLKYQNKFSAPEAPFNTVISKIKREVEDELERVSNDFKIDFQYSTLHDDQLKPTFEICLSTKISNQDCLVLISSVIPQPSIYSNYLELLTNDNDFAKFVTDSDIDPLFSSFNIPKPSVSHIERIIGNINLTKDNDTEKVHAAIKNLITNLIIVKNQELFLGKTFKPHNTALPENLICFKLEKGVVVRKDIYITVLSKDLDFIYTSKIKVPALHHNGSALAEGFVSQSDENINVSYMLVDLDINGAEVAADKQITSAIRQEGNLVFIHPDS